MLRAIWIFMFGIIVFSSFVYSQEEEQQLNLKGKHSISMSMGMRTNTTSIIVRTPSMYSGWNDDDVNIKAGFMGTFSYNYWFDNEWSVNFQVGIISADVDMDYIPTSSDDYTDVSSNTITPFLMGFKYYPKYLAMGTVGRAYAGINFGAYIGTTSKTSYWLIHETTIETVFGAEPNAGVDLFVTKWLRLGPSLSYNIHTKFKSVGLNNDNAFGFMFNMGVVI
jgi:hypothetical protein